MLLNRREKMKSRVELAKADTKEGFIFKRIVLDFDELKEAIKGECVRHVIEYILEHDFGHRESFSFLVDKCTKSVLSSIVYMLEKGNSDKLNLNVLIDKNILSRVDKVLDKVVNEEKTYYWIGEEEN